MTTQGVQIFSVAAIKEVMVYILAGHVLIEKASESPLINGLRKSLFFDTVQDKQSFAECIGAMEADGTNVAKSKAVLDLFKHGGP